MALKMIKPKKQICENDIFSHILNKDAIGAILLKNKRFKKQLNNVKKLKYDMFKKDYSIINGTHEED